MKNLFDNLGIDESKYTIYEMTIEEYKSDMKYDFVIAEGFIHALDNYREIMSILESFLNVGGVLTVTCMDVFSMFVEQVKRIICQLYIRNNCVEEVLEDKVEACKKALGAHQMGSKWASRNVEDWIKDDLINPAFNNHTIMDFEKAINAVGEKCVVLGASQNIFRDLSWYKDLSYNRNELCIREYRQKKYLFLSTEQCEDSKLESNCDNIEKKLSEMRELSIMLENTDCDWRRIGSDIIMHLHDLENTFEELLIYQMTQYIQVAISTMEKIMNNNIFLDQSSVLNNMVGRTQLYISFMKECI